MNNKNVCCDPGMCDDCIYLGDGDFICDAGEEPVLVIDSWEPTESYGSCMNKG